MPEANSPEIREIIVQGYRVIYRLRREEAEILTIHHGSRPINQLESLGQQWGRVIGGIQPKCA